jgi:hypothetical protein
VSGRRTRAINRAVREAAARAAAQHLEGLNDEGLKTHQRRARRAYTRGQAWGYHRLEQDGKVTQYAVMLVGRPPLGFPKPRRRTQTRLRRKGLGW